MDNQYYYNQYGEESEKKNYRLAFILGSLAVLLIAIVLAVMFLLIGKVNSDKYNSAIGAGNHYFTSGQYQLAIEQYQLAISIDEKEMAAYLNLATVYIQIGDYNSALDIIGRGLSYADNDASVEKLNNLKTLPDTKFNMDAQQKPLTQEEIKEVCKDARVESTILDTIAAYTYTDYYRDFGNVSATIPEAKKISFYYDSVLMETIYYDIAAEKVMNASNTAPIATAKPCIVKLHSLEKLFDSGSERFAISYDKLKEMFGNKISIEVDNDNNRYYVQAEYKHCLIKLESDSAGNIISKYAWNEISPMVRGAIADNAEAEGSASGYVMDATTGRGMKATLKIRNRGVRNGSTITEIESNTDGSYCFEGMSGNYTAEVCAQGYVTEYLDLDIIKNQTRTGMNIVLSPVVAQGELRIVLTWGAYPTDLDSHAAGKSSSGANFHIYFADRFYNGVGELDVDDTNGYGPETITIKDFGSTFTYSVVDFTNSQTMSSSGAVVKVYLPDGSVREFYVPAGTGNTWTVFEFSNGQINPKNVIN